jgi:uncharacterized RDD family membrane protein YckC
MILNSKPESGSRTGNTASTMSTSPQPIEGSSRVDDQLMGDSISYEVTGLVPRFVSAVLDQLVISLIMFAIDIWALIFGISIPGRMTSIISLCIGLTYFEYYWTRRDGQTPGKRAMGLRVVAVDGGQITHSMAVGRYFGYGLNTLTLGLGWLAVVFDKQHRGWGLA